MSSVLLSSGALFANDSRVANRNCSLCMTHCYSQHEDQLLAAGSQDTSGSSLLGGRNGDNKELPKREHYDAFQGQDSENSLMMDNTPDPVTFQSKWHQRKAFRNQHIQNEGLTRAKHHKPSSFSPPPTPIVSHISVLSTIAVNKNKEPSPNQLHSHPYASEAPVTATMIDFDKMFRAIKAFEQYGSNADESFVSPRVSLYDSLSVADKQIVGQLWKDKQDLLLYAMSYNQELATAIADYSKQFFINQGYEEEMKHFSIANVEFKPSNEEKAIARSVIRQIWRDWSLDAKDERKTCFSSVRQYLGQKFDQKVVGLEDRSSVNVLIPGSGLNRLAFDLSMSGYTVEANEVSYIHLLATNFILSRTDNGFGHCDTEGYLGNMKKYGAQASQSTFKIFPWALSFSNHTKMTYQFTSTHIPELMPAGSKNLGSPPVLDCSAVSLAFTAPRLSINDKNFMEDYTSPSSAGQYDVIITCFFIDTAPNLLSYIRTVNHLLKPKGTWLNVGPLLWNCYENGPGGRREGDIDADEDHQTRQPVRPIHQDVGENWDRKLEFSHEEVIIILESMGFEVTQDKDVGTAGYCLDTRAMMTNEYKLKFWVATKKAGLEEAFTKEHHCLHY